MNMRLTVDVQIRLGSAKVDINKQQRDTITAFVTRLITGEKQESTERRTRSRKPQNNHKWNEIDDAKIITAVMGVPEKYPNNTQAFKAVAQEIGRSLLAVSTRYHNTLKNKVPRTRLLG